jgi:hypothetical protein
MRKFKALVSETGLDDFGASGMTFRVDQLVKGRIYTQEDTTNWDAAAKRSAPFFVDDNGCSRNIERSLKEGIIEEVFEYK